MKNDILVKIDNLSIAYDKETVLEALSLALTKGELVCILGPSGSGKTSILRALAGFIDIQYGSIAIDDKIVSIPERKLSPSERNLGVVFQDFALFPHLSVQKNVEFGLHHLSKHERQERAFQYMQIMDIVKLADKYPADLSGGQQQRVAIARAIAPQPQLLLLDEAFSSLDPVLRQQIAYDMRQIIKKLGLTAILITHEQSEAFAFADKIAVLANGRLQQFAPAYDLYHRPKTQFVANFIGEGAFIKAELTQENNEILVTSAIGKINLPTIAVEALDLTHFQGKDAFKHINYQILLRPDDVIHDDSSEHKAIIENKEFRGAYICYHLRLQTSQESVLCFAPSHHDHAVGESFGIKADIEHVICFPA